MPGNTLKALNALNARNTLNALNALMPNLDALAQLPGWSRQPVCPATRLVLGNLFARLTFYPAPTRLFRVARIWRDLTGFEMIVGAFERI